MFIDWPSGMPRLYVLGRTTTISSLERVYINYNSFRKIRTFNYPKNLWGVFYSRSLQRAQSISGRLHNLYDHISKRMSKGLRNTQCAIALVSTRSSMRMWMKRSQIEFFGSPAELLPPPLSPGCPVGLKEAQLCATVLWSYRYWPKQRLTGALLRTGLF